VSALHCYIDESISPKEREPVPCVAGWLSTGKDWWNFAKAWNAVLEPKGVELFHACEFETEEGRRGTVYEKWSKPERDEFQNKLIIVINKTLWRDVGIAIPQSVYNQVMTPKRIEKWGDIYVLCGKLAIVKAASLAFKYGFNAPNYFIEKGGGYEGKLKAAHEGISKMPEFAERFTMSVIEPIPKSKKHPELSAADYLAFNVSKRASHLFDPEEPLDESNTIMIDGKRRRKLRYPLAQMWGYRGEQGSYIFDTERLEDVISNVENLERELGL
jgi:hypothetical protein